MKSACIFVKAHASQIIRLSCSVIRKLLCTPTHTPFKYDTHILHWSHASDYTLKPLLNLGLLDEVCGFFVVVAVSFFSFQLMFTSIWRSVIALGNGVVENILSLFDKGSGSFSNSFFAHLDGICYILNQGQSYC